MNSENMKLKPHSDYEGKDPTTGSFLTLMLKIVKKSEEKIKIDI